MAYTNNTITQEMLHELFEYRDGNLYWKITNSPRAVAGSKAGTVRPTGHIAISINGTQYMAHRLVWMMHNKNCPKIIDHIDCDPLNNKIANLREATHAQNMQNSKTPLTNKSGIKGVYWSKQKCRWFAKTSINGKQKLIGIFKNINDAEEAVKIVRSLHHKEFANHG